MSGSPEPSPSGEPVIDDSFVLVANADYRPVGFRLPARRFGNRWRQVVSTADPAAPEGANTWPARAEVPLDARAVLLLRRAW